jgi:hypothetical protein
MVNIDWIPHQIFWSMFSQKFSTILHKLREKFFDLSLNFLEILLVVLEQNLVNVYAL